MAQAHFTTTVLRCRRPSREVCFADTVEYRLTARLICVRSGGVITSRFFQTLLSTADHFSVAFPFHQHDLLILNEPVAVTYTPTWLGIPCRAVRLRLGLEVVESPHPRPFRLLALVPLDEDAIPDDMPPLLR